MILRKTLLTLIYITVPFVLYSQEVEKDILLKDIRILSSSQMEGRKSLTKGNLMAREYIKLRFDSLGLTSQFRDYTQFFPVADNGGEAGKGQGANILGFIPGQESAKLIVIMAHYDHLGTSGDEIYHGADDNASGTAGLLALASYFSKNKPRHSLMFAALDAEEMGLQGAKALIENFPFPFEDVLVSINMDMISRSEKKVLYAAGTSHYPQLKPILEEAAQGSAIQIEFGHDEPGTGSEDWTNASDHAAFHKKGIPFVYFGVEDHEDYHKPTDVFSNIDQDFYYQAVNFILACVLGFDNQEQANFTLKTFLKLPRKETPEKLNAVPDT